MAKAEYRSAIRSRKLINEALADLLQEKPLDKITVTDVVKRAGINRGTFYAHYMDIPDVINHLIQKAFARIRDAILDSHKQLADMPGVLLQQLQGMLEEDLDFYRKVLTSSVSSLMQDQLIEIVIEYLLQHEAAFSGVSHDKYVFAIRFCAGGISKLYWDWFAGKLPISLEELTQRATQMLGCVITQNIV